MFSPQASKLTGPANARRQSANVRTRVLRMELLERRELMTAALQPLAGDFDGDGVDTPGLFDAATARFHLRNANTPGFPQVVLTHPQLQSGTPLAGDWDNDGSDTVGLFDTRTNTFRLAVANSADTAVLEITVTDAPPGGVPLVGDWNGDGRDSVAIYDAANYRFYLKETLASGAADQVISFWPSDRTSDMPLGYQNPIAWTAVAGDFVAEGRDTVGLYQASSRLLYAQKSPGEFLYRRSQIAPTRAVDAVLLTGDWDNSGDDSIGFWDRKSQIFHERNWLTSSAYEAELYVPASTTTIPLLAGEPRSSGEARSNPRIVAMPLGSTAVATQTSPAPMLPSAFPQDTAAIAALLSDAQKNFITKGEVGQLLKRAAAASSSQDAIIAIVDRGGRILGVRVEQAVLGQYAALYPDPAQRTRQLVFAIDGAVAKARTAASFANGDFDLIDRTGKQTGIAPLTSRTIRNLSQSTVTEREVDSNPNFRDRLNFPNPFASPILGPGFVAPIGLGGHFPPDVSFTPPVDLFHIEHQGRDSSVHPGRDGLKGTIDDIPLPGRFNVAPARGPLSQFSPPDSYGYVSGRFRAAQSRGFATLPGGIPLYKDLSPNFPGGDTLVGGIGVFFPGPLGYATFEQGFVPQQLLPPGHVQTTLQRLNAPRALEAEWIAFAAAGGSGEAARMYSSPGLSVGALGGVPRVAGYDLPFGRIDLVGITLEIYGPHPTQHNPQPGPITLLRKGQQVGQGSANSGQNQRVTADPTVKALEGKPLPFGWLVLPQASGNLSVADIERIVQQGITQAEQTRAAIRLPAGTRTAMVLSITDKNGNVLGVFRMQDATVFSIDVSIAKARNTAYYADPTALQPEDFVDDDLLRPDLLAAAADEINPNGLGEPDIYADAGSTIPFDDSRGLAFTNRTFRFLAEPRYPAGQDGTFPPVFSILTDPGIHVGNGEILRPNGVTPLNIPAQAFTSVAGFDAFHVGRNLHDSSNIANQNGVVFFPGSTPLYDRGLAGGFGVSGDGVDQDDVVTAAGQEGFAAPLGLRADRVFYRGVRLPFQKFNRNPEG